MLVSSEKCIGCFACSNACPTECISPIMDKEGFFQPSIDKSKCINCKKCEKACPMMNESIKNGKKTPTVYAAWSKDDKLLEKSSSGGIFGVVAKKVIENNGVVFGAAYNYDLSVAHTAAKTMDELNRLHGSKYVQSAIGITYQDTKKALDKNKLVLFSGTPCQVAGLYQYLGRDYSNLYTCDIVCHGVPSPGVYRRYLDYVQKKEGKELVEFEMRSKRNGWTPIFTSRLVFTDGSEIKKDNAYKDPYMNGFLFNLYLRKPCYTCKYAKTERESDLTLADFWGIGKELPFEHETKQGVSLVLVNSKKGETLIEECKEQIEYIERTMEEAIAGNPMLLPHTNRNESRDDFYKDYEKLPFEQLIRKYLHRDFSFSFKLKNLIVKIVGVRNIKRVKVLLKRSH